MACLANLGGQRHFKNSTGPETLEGPKRVQSKISSFYMLSNSPWYKWFHSVLNHLHFEGHLDCLLFLFLLISCYKYLQVGFCMNIRFHFSSINVQDCNCWVIWQFHIPCLVFVVFLSRNWQSVFHTGCAICISTNTE